MGAGAVTLQSTGARITGKVFEAAVRSLRVPFEIITDRPILTRGGVFQTK